MYTKSCAWCGGTFETDDRGIKYCDYSCYAAYNGLPDMDYNVCACCGGPLTYMGTLGRHDVYRCRDCGAETLEGD